MKRSRPDNGGQGVEQIVLRRALFVEWEGAFWALLYVVYFQARGVADFMGRLCLVAANGDLAY
jgi:hypothetical protein